MKNPSAVHEYEILTEDQLVLERIMLALRTSEGIDESFLLLHADPDGLERALCAGNLERISCSVSEGARLRIPESRFFVSDAIISSLI